MPLSQRKEDDSIRLIELEITNFRGLPQILLKPAGKNLVIWGPNGSGKSAVVDAVDFLLTGQISRLGEGTKGLTLKKHGPHVGAKPKDTRVRALIQIPGHDQPVEISRSLSHPAKLECPEEARPLLEPILEVARKGQHVLTRREILKYVTSDASTRAQQIHVLLNISEVEEIRKSLVKVQTEANREVSAAQIEVTNAMGAVNATTQHESYVPQQVLDLVNRSRGVLGGQPLQVLESSRLKDGLNPPALREEDVKAPNPSIVEKDIQNLLKCFDPVFRDSIISSETALRELWAEVRADDTLMRALKQVDLTSKGLSLLDESGMCPLCDTPWDPTELRQHLQQKLSKASVAREYQEQIEARSSKLLMATTTIESSLQKTISATQALGDQDTLAKLQEWLDSLHIFMKDLRKAREGYPESAAAGLATLFAPTGIEDLLAGILARAQELSPKVTPEQTAWDTLTRLEENVKGLESAQKRKQQADLWYSRASNLLNSFLAARDEVLSELYESVRERFVSLYRELHGPDEKDFTAKLEPDGAGITLEVDFYGRGTYPPNALHSEGHQDSMGLCLYLALSERLTSGVIDLVILDDVVMSVDADHRRQLCTLLATEFKNKQFLITTHDRNWAGQLQSEGVVTSSECIEFFNWNVDTGPQINHVVDLWDRIQADLERGNVPSAAHKLRRGSEEYLSNVCDALQAKVSFKLSGRYELGDLMPAAMSQYKKLIGQAKKSAQSWGRAEQIEQLKKLESIYKPIFIRTNAEQWAINPNVHYNKWVDFSPNDFVPVRDAFQDFFSLFRCSKCESLIRLISDKTEAVAVRCNCGDFNWNLTVKPKRK